MKRFAVAAACVLLSVMLVGCGGKSQDASSISAASGSADASAASNEASASESSAAPPSSDAKEDKNGFSADTNNTITIAGVEFQIPDYYERGKPNTNEKGATSTVYTAESSKESAVMLLSVEQSGSGIKTENFEKAKDALTEAFANLNNATENATVTEKVDLVIAGFSGRAFTAQGTYNGFTVYELGIFFFNDELSAVGSLSYYVVGDPKYDYYPDFEKTIDSARAVESSNGANDETATDSGQSDQGSLGEVSPDLKEMLDSYEAFIDEYVEFMNSYNESGDAMSMLSQYTEYMQKYSDLVQKIDSVDTNNMSAADYAYYIEVTSRVSQKLLEASVL